MALPACMRCDFVGMEQAGYNFGYGVVPFPVVDRDKQTGMQQQLNHLFIVINVLVLLSLLIFMTDTRPAHSPPGCRAK